MRDLGAFVEDNFLNDDCCSGHPVDLGKTGLSTAGSLSSETSLCSFPVPCGDKIGRKSQRVKAAATQESHTCRISSVCVTNVPSTNGTVVGVNGVPKVKYDDVFSSAQAEESTWSSKRTTYKRPRVTPSFSAASSCSTDGARRRRELLASLPPPSNKLPNNLLGGGSILCFDASRIANQSADKAFPKSPETLGTKEESRSSRALAEESGDAGTVEGDICKADKQEKGGASLSSLFTLYDSDNDDAQSSEGKSAANQRAVLPEVKKEEKYCDGMSGPEPFVNIPSASCGGDTSALQKEEFEGSPSHRLQNPTSYSAVDDICAHIGVPAELVKASGLTAGELREMQRAGVTDVSGASLQDPDWQLNAAASGQPLRKKKLYLATKVWNAQEKAVVETTEPKQMQKRKHQINWLAAEAHEKELEMLELTARTRQTKYQTAMKYGW